jgi:hypothetical protein
MENMLIKEEKWKDVMQFGVHSVSKHFHLLRITEFLDLLVLHGISETGFMSILS